MLRQPTGKHGLNGSFYREGGADVNDEEQDHDRHSVKMDMTGLVIAAETWVLHRL